MKHRMGRLFISLNTRLDRYLEKAGQPPPPRFYAQKWWIASAVFVLVVVVWGIVFTFTSGGGTAVTPTRAAASASDSACGLPAGSQDPVVTPPANTKWTLSGSIAAPSIPGVGPGIVDGHDRRCYAHSPLGATLAAANYVAMAGLPNGALTAAQALGHLAPGHVRDVYANQPTPNITPTERFQIEGVRDDVVDPDNVTVTLAVRTNAGVWASWSLPMTFMNGDWRVRLLSVQEPYIIAQLASLDGYITWSGT
jgi:hypothetical protein